MPDPRLVSRAQRAATMLERAWDRWRAAHGLAAEPLPPVSSYVGYSIEEPWGRPRVVFGVDAADAEKLAALLHECAASPRVAEQPQPAGGSLAVLAQPDHVPQQDLDEVRARIPVQGRTLELSAAREQRGDPDRHLGRDLGRGQGGDTDQVAGSVNGFHQVQADARPQDQIPLGHGPDRAVADTNDPAAADTEDPAVADTEDPAVADTDDLSVADTEDPALANADDLAVAGTEDPAVADTDDLSVPGTEDPATADTAVADADDLAVPATADADALAVAGTEDPAVADTAGADTDALAVADTDALAVADTEDPAAAGHAADAGVSVTPVSSAAQDEAAAWPADGDAPAAAEDPADDQQELSADADSQPSGDSVPHPQAGGAAAGDHRDISRGVADTMAAELAGWAAGELPGQASARLAAWATVGGASARNGLDAEPRTGGAEQAS